MRGNKGFGYEHVSNNEDRMKKLKGLGFEDFINFAEVVAKNFTEIKGGNNGRQIVIHYHRAHGLQLVIQPILHDDNTLYWSIVTGIPGRSSDKGTFYTVSRDQAPPAQPRAQKRPILTLKPKSE